MRPFQVTRSRLAIVAALLSAAASPLAAQRSRRPADDTRSTLTRDRTGAWRLDLAPEVEDALDRFDRDFEPWDARFYPALPDGYEPTPRQVPWAVLGDFNGDGRTDVALAGRDDRDALVLVVLSTGRTRYRVIEADRDPLDPDDPGSVRAPVLWYMYPGRYVIADPRLVYPREIVVEQPAIQLTGARRPGPVLLTVENEGLARYYLSDRPAGPPVRQGPGVPAPASRAAATRRRATPRPAAATADSATRSR
jgi:hypothetical protein